MRALRIHALERNGKVREALILLWEVVVGDVVVIVGGAGGSVGGVSNSTQQRQVWSELYQRIQALSTVDDIIHEGHASSSTNRGGRASHNHHRSLGDIQLLDAVRRLDIRSYAPIVNPYLATIKDDKKKDAITTTKPLAKASKGSAKKLTSDNNSIICHFPPVTDDTVLQTLSVTLRNCELYDTMSEMYHQATMALSSSSKLTATTEDAEQQQEEDEDNYRNVLEEGVCVHLKAVCDCTYDSGYDSRSANRGEDNKKIEDYWSRIVLLQSQLPQLQSLLNMTKYYERMQTSECVNGCCLPQKTVTLCYCPKKYHASTYQNLSIFVNTVL